MYIYTIYDRVAQEAGPIFEAKNDAVALRSAEQLLERSERSDFAVYRLGQFDRETMQLSVESVPRQIDIADEFNTKEEVKE